MTKTDPTLLQMALIGYETRLQEIQAKMAAIQSVLKGGMKASVDGPSTRAPRRKISAAGKRRIAAAQKKRWAEFHAKAEKPARKVAVKKAAPKRKLSPARKAALVANLAKARAAKAAKKAAAA